MAARRSITPVAVAAALVVAVLVGALLWLRTERADVDQAANALTRPAATLDRTAGEAASPGVSRTASPSMGSSIVSPAPPRPSTPSRMTPEVRERRQRVLDSLATRAPSAAANAALDPAPPKDKPAEMRDRTGVMPETVKALNTQFSPLVAQCVDQAQERGVNQRGMLALAVKLASAEGIGHIIEAIEPTATNAIDDAELIDCLRESAFTVDLPAEGSRHTDFEMTIAYGPPRTDAGAASGQR